MKIPTNKRSIVSRYVELFNRELSVSGAYGGLHMHAKQPTTCPWTTSGDHPNYMWKSCRSKDLQVLLFVYVGFTFESTTWVNFCCTYFNLVMGQKDNQNDTPELSDTRSHFHDLYIAIFSYIKLLYFSATIRR